MRLVAFAALSAMSLLGLPEDCAQDQTSTTTDAGTSNIVLVKGTMTDNTCGTEAFGATSPWTFEVKMYKDGDHLVWNTGGESVSGALSNGSFTIASRSTVNLNPSAAKPCVLSREDAASGTVTLSGSNVVSFTGTLSYTFSADAESPKCDQVLAEEGVYALPCRISYSLVGVAE